MSPARYFREETGWCSSGSRSIDSKEDLPQHLGGGICGRLIPGQVHVRVVQVREPGGSGDFLEDHAARGELHGRCRNQGNPEAGGDERQERRNLAGDLGDLGPCAHRVEEPEHEVVEVSRLPRRIHHQWQAGNFLDENALARGQVMALRKPDNQTVLLDELGLHSGTRDNGAKQPHVDRSLAQRVQLLNRNRLTQHQGDMRQVL